MDQRLWKCVNRYRVRTEFDYILDMSTPCEAQVEGTVYYSHIMSKVSGEELDELNANRAEREMKRLSSDFYALTLYDAQLSGEGTEENGAFRKYLHERIRMEEERGRSLFDMLHLLSWSSEPIEVCDESGERQYLDEEELIGRRVRVSIKMFSRGYHPGYALSSVTLLEGTPGILKIAEEREKSKREVMRQVVANNKEISKLLKTNMDLLMESGLRSKQHDPYFESEEDKIIFPKGYIKHKAEYEKLYKLDELIHDEVIRSNVEYCLQMSDVYSFLDNYFSTYGSVNMAIKKAAFVNLVSVMEALILLVVEEARKGCRDCPEEKCAYRFPIRKNNLSERIKQLKELDIFHWEDRDYDLLLQCARLRNRIHLASLNGEEAKNDMTDYAEEFEKLYEELLGLMETLSFALYAHLLPESGQCLKEYAQED